jgi:CRISPR-associated protein Csy1
MAVPSLPTENSAALRQLIHGFIQERLQAKLDKLKPDEEEKRQSLEASHQQEIWLADAARRVSRLQLASHTIKPIHSDARGSNLHIGTALMTLHGLVSTYSLNGSYTDDAAGDAAALFVFKFLNLEHEAQSLLQRVLDDDLALKAALSDDQELAQTWQSAFASIAKNKHKPSSHTLAKQLYFPLADGGYHLLAPLFPTSLVHQAHRTMREHRFGDDAKAARDARRKKLPWHEGYHEYPDLLIQNFGGTKPQNISQLNSERYGENWLLPSLPPLWKSPEIRPPFHADSIFDSWFGRRRSVRHAVVSLRHFLAATARNNKAIRQERAERVRSICDEALQYAAQLRELPPGWSAATECRLDESEQLWLDPLRALSDEDFMKRRLWADWPLETSKRFANWLNASIDSARAKLGEDEAAQWTHDLQHELGMFKEILDDDRS